MTTRKRMAIAVILGVLLIGLISIEAAAKGSTLEDFVVIAAVGTAATCLFVYAMWAAGRRN